MATLSRELRKALEKVVLAARSEAEAGARKALEQLAVAHRDPWPTMSPEQQALRRRLRARGRQLGDRLEDGGTQGREHLVSECAYEQWHRMLFARFLAECGLLIEPSSGVSVSIDECKELARERGGDWISLASTFAQRMLPQIFRADDAVLEIVLPAENRQPLEKLLLSLPAAVFLADDSLGWVYQFWQSEEKDRVNKSEAKIGADQLPAVTQLFTEDYMVEFLLHNTLGAWWAGRRFPSGVPGRSEEQARAAISLPGVDFRHLRFFESAPGSWTPVAGVFERWPSTAQGIRILDPCMGSGHFLAAALPLLVAIRRFEEGSALAAACAEVITENIYGLEVDPRCTQIGAFNLALAAWKLGGWQPLSSPNIACSGLGLNAKREEWVLLAGADQGARLGMEHLYDLFAKAPALGSLINPRSVGDDLLVSGFTHLQPLLERALLEESLDDNVHELAVTAKGVARAASLLSDRFTLVATNVPYLGRPDQAAILKSYCEQHHRAAQSDLATCFVQRSLGLCDAFGTVALVTPQSWLSQPRYNTLRQELLASTAWHLLCRLGPRAFETISGERVNVCLIALSNAQADAEHLFAGLDVTGRPNAVEKQRGLLTDPLASTAQAAQLRNPDHRITLEALESARLLGQHAVCVQGLATSDDPQFTCYFWEIPRIAEGWEGLMGTVASTCAAGGRERLLYWEEGTGRYFRHAQALKAEGRLGGWKSGTEARGTTGILVSQMSTMPVTVYTGEFYDHNASVLITDNPEKLPAIWTFAASKRFAEEVRKLDHSLKPSNSVFVKVPFDLDYWTREAASQYPEGLPVLRTKDATQWIFDGHPGGALDPLQVAVARLVGYRWPRQTGSCFVDSPALDADDMDAFADDDGIVCMVATKGEEAASARLGALLNRAYGQEWTAETLGQLLNRVGCAGQTLDAWLRDAFFAQHCELFHQHPFVWHVWDGLKDGFGALVNYHKLTRANLEKLTYGYLGDWIRRQEASVAAAEAGSDARFVAAKQLQDQLKGILEGEPPLDVFVRWKPLAEQPIGWQPDLNDGVRMNIRPFLMTTDVGRKGAGILRARPNIKWDKDRGKEPLRSRDEFPWFWGWDGTSRDFRGNATFDGNRWNYLHYSREFKSAARRQVGQE
jgi:hypothetical protein